MKRYNEERENELPLSNEPYFDWEKNKIIQEDDICEYADWHQSKEFSCSQHPSGFKVFVAKEAIDSTNEYEDEDPYDFDENSIFHRSRIESTLHLIEFVFKKDSEIKILDIGCGKGYITNKIKQNYRFSEVSALDYSFSAIHFAHQNFKNIDFIVADAYNIPYCKDYFDLVICNNIWEHVPDPLNMLKAIKKVQKKDGYLIISTPSRYRFGNIIRLLRGKSVQFMSDKHITEFSVGQIIEQLKHGEYTTIKVYAKKNYTITGVFSMIAFGIMKPILKFLLFCFKKSPYMLESTCYFLAINKKND